MKKRFSKKNKEEMFSSKKNEEVDDSVFVKHKIEEEINIGDDIFLSEEKLGPEEDLNFEKEISFNRRRSNKDVQQDLLEIYSEDGTLPDFQTIKIKKKRPFLLSFFYYLIILAFLVFTGHSIYTYFQNTKDASSVLELQVSAPNKVVLGEDFMYEINYKNNSNYTLSDVNIDITYPENFILAEVYSIDTYHDDKHWQISEIGPKISGTIKIRGKIINQEGLNNLLSVKSRYGIKGLNSVFTKDTFFSLAVSSIPFSKEDIFSSTVLVGEEYPLEIKINNFPQEKIPHFQIFFNNSDDVVLLYNEKDNEEAIKNQVIEKLDAQTFKVDPSKSSGLNFHFKYKINEKKEEEQILFWGLKYVDEEGHEFVFWEKKNILDVIKSDLHLSLSINEQGEDFPVNFGDQLDYVIKYSNKGDKKMKNVIIMAVLESDFIDLNSLVDKNKGKLSRKTISWSYSEIPDLREIGPGQGGEIKFSLNASDAKRIAYSQKKEIKSYAQFSIGNIEDFKDSADHLSDNRSNVIVNRLNSDLSIKEQVLYFDEDNIPVGSGPLPPVVGEKSTFRYYWTLKNTLHELRDLRVDLDLPDYVIWGDNYNVSAGNLDFDYENNRVTFNISRWPLGVDQVDINFDVSIIPSESEYNKIIILSSGSKLEATDVETNAVIYKETDVKTSKLEDDSIAAYNNDGRVR